MIGYIGMKVIRHNVKVRMFICLLTFIFIMVQSELKLQVHIKKRCFEPNKQTFYRIYRLDR